MSNDNLVIYRRYQYRADVQYEIIEVDMYVTHSKLSAAYVMSQKMFLQKVSMQVVWVAIWLTI
jgi:hypothetical protein